MVKLHNDIYLDSSCIIHNRKKLNKILNNTIEVIDSQICETNETLNGKKIYGYRLTFSQTLNKGVQYTFDLPFASDIEYAWVDLGNSFMDNHKMVASFNTWCLGSYDGFKFRIGIIAKNQLSINCDDNWSDNWTFNVMIKFTKR